MDEYIQFSAKTKNEAITKACIELGVSSDQLDIQVISEGSSGFFGFGSKPAIIKVRKLKEVSEDAEIEKIVDSVKLESFKEEEKKEAPKSAPKAKQNTKTADRPEQKKEEAKEAEEIKESRPQKEKRLNRSKKKSRKKNL